MGTLAGRFPDDIARGASGGHGYWSTSIVESVGGQVTANQVWQYARGRWDVARAIEQTGKHELARAHFYKARGRRHTFRFKDWLDFRCARTGTDKGRITGAGTAWQCAKAYGTDDVTYEYVRPLKRIVSLTDQIWRNGTLQTRGSDYTIAIDTGVITSAISWTGATLELACDFDVLCRYEIDEFAPRLVFRSSDAEMLFEWDSIKIVEERE